MWRSGPPSTVHIPRPTRPTTPNSIQIQSADFPQFTGQTDTHTDKYARTKKYVFNDFLKWAVLALPTELFLFQQQLRWLGHLIRMPSTCLPCKVLYGQLIGQRSKEGQNKHFKDDIKACLKKCNVPFSQLEALAANQNTWKSTCETCLTISWQPPIKLQRTGMEEGMLSPISLPASPAVLPVTKSASELKLRSHSKPQVQ